MFTVPESTRVHELGSQPADWVASTSMTNTTGQRWVDALEAFEVAQRARGAQASTIARRVKHVRRFVVDVAGELSPWHVTTEHVQGWLEDLEVAAATRASMRDSLRAFYRWGCATGRSVMDPTEATSRRALRLDVPAAWEQPLTAYERFLWARGVAPASVELARSSLRTFARQMGSIEPFAVTVDDLYEWMAGQRWARETRRSRKATLRGFYGWAVDTGRIAENPTERMPVVKAGDPVARPATDAEYQAALEAASVGSDDRWALALRLAAELGLRRGEVAQVHTADLVRREDGSTWLTVHGKGAKVRRVPLPSTLWLSLSEKPGGYVFPGQIVDKHAHAGVQGHISARYMGKRIAALLPAGVTMHALRHRFATKAYNVDRDVFTVQRLLGHASASTTQRYVQVSDERMRALVEAVAS